MKLKAVCAVVTVIVVAPIWYYLLYQILVRVNATELMMFLFWAYVPIGILVQALNAIANSQE